MRQGKCMDKVRVGLLGTGAVIRNAHIPALQATPNAEIVAACNLHAPSLQRLAHDYKIPRVYTDFASMAADSDIDAVVVGLPNYLHAPVSIQMLAAGKHVLCEKPMATTVADAEEMVRVASKAGVSLMVAHMWRFDPEIAWLREIVQSGRLGQVFKVKSYAIWSGGGPEPGSWFTRSDSAGGGAFADLAIHSIDTLCFVLGGLHPTRVYANLATHFRVIPVEDTGIILLEFREGIIGLIEAGWYHNYSDGAEGRTQIFGTIGYAQTQPAELQACFADAWSVTRPKMPERQPLFSRPMFTYQMQHFVECIIDNRTPDPDGQQGLLDLQILEAAYRSAADRTVVSVKSSR